MMMIPPPRRAVNISDTRLTHASAIHESGGIIFVRIGRMLKNNVKPVKINSIPSPLYTQVIKVFSLSAASIISSALFVPLSTRVISDHDFAI